MKTKEQDRSLKLRITSVRFAENVSGLFDGMAGITLETALKKSLKALKVRAENGLSIDFTGAP
jgi:hypothetical protein